MITFNIARWRAWAPGLASADEWEQWSRTPTRLQDSNEAPDVSFLPAMQRRRLGRMARMAFAVGWPLSDGHERMPLVFVSRHGETPRTFDILRDLAADEPMSPTQFSLSVHNAVIGLWSILRGETSEMTALAAAGDGLEYGAFEAAALLAEGAPAVLLVVTEEQPPHAYARWIDDVPFPYAVGLLLTPGNEWQLSLNIDTQGAQRTQWPHALNLLQALHTDQSSCLHPWNNRLWKWQRNH
ncbi:MULTISPECIES: beta-ketoacyl synthase chain length factor [Pseudomonas]|uniref:3-oxoacyl-ACP synthase n=2 Tax=Pseudomonas viridiflava TaxID=33069 RepID=A0AA46ZRR7_PSEVI|nr:MULTISPECIES: beta-ketoacyl synthase chain length factor [Pseudomonas]KTC13488.1 3-oxoacyl-ACP synthase [Pseudomonas marginalis ICMP 11289]MCF8977460.1 3-oxoacyl-ACP synthase [Pseudomonas syringae]MBV1806484.1 beta-ketoacyl synthase chain length factor [Pseudomonas viridiflava]MBV1816017.1 beta-ketoacyl synthase chain length factor [Pseudomonas viridiflava]MEE4074230.1 beta-ketoacyl synthase chain length factor [Pseudomonas viridiflava]